MSSQMMKAKQVLAAAGVVGALAVATSAGAQNGGLERAVTNPQSSFTATLTGANEVPGPGDTDGTGTAAVTINVSTGEVCVNLSTANIEPITAAHIHSGAPGVAGPPVVDLAITSGNSAAKCVTTTPTQAQTIVSAPTSFYVNVHTATFPDGAIRGQLAVQGPAAGQLMMLTEPARAYDSRGGVKLAGNEVRTVDLTQSVTAGTTGVPIGARAAIVTLTVTQTVDGGYLTLFSNALEGIPATSTVNWTVTNSDVAATTTVAVDGSGKVKVAAGPNGTHVIVDVIGYYM